MSLKILSLIFILSSNIFSQSDVVDLMSKGQIILKEKKCTFCHLIKGYGEAKIGPELESSTKGKSYFEIIGSLWTHAPFMKDKMDYYGLPWPQLEEKDVEIIFDFLYYLNFFNFEGRKEEGEKIFYERKCILCHQRSGKAIPPEDFPENSTFLYLGKLLIEHQDEMKEEFKKKNLNLKPFYEEDIKDIFAFIKYKAVGKEDKEQYFQKDLKKGENIFKLKCLSCHNKGSKDLNKSLAEIIAVLWNHNLEKKTVSFKDISVKDFGNLLLFIYLMYKEPPNFDKEKGREVFLFNCAPCHSFKKEGGKIASTLDNICTNEKNLSLKIWNALPNMIKIAKEKNISMVKLKGYDTQNLFYYLCKE